MTRETLRVKLRPAPRREPARAPMEHSMPSPGRAALERLAVTVLTGGARALDAAAAALGRGARIMEGVADARALPLAPRPAVIIRAAAGRTTQHDFLVANDRTSRLTGAVRSTDLYSDAGMRPAAQVVRFAPEQVDLGGGQVQPVRAWITLPASAAGGAVYRATFHVEGHTRLRLPVEVHVTRGSHPITKRGEGDGSTADG